MVREPRSYPLLPFRSDLKHVKPILDRAHGLHLCPCRSGHHDEGRRLLHPGHRGWIRLHEKGGNRHEVSANHNLDEYLERYIEAVGLAAERSLRCSGRPSAEPAVSRAKPMAQADVHRMIRRRAKEAGIKTKIGGLTFRAAGITAYLKNGHKLETAEWIAAHESSRTTGLYDRRDDDISLDEVERIAI